MDITLLKHRSLTCPADKTAFVIGDIHGQYTSFLRLLQKIKYNPQKHLLISVGDLINKGPHSLACLMFFLYTPGTYCVIGNNEKAFIEYAACEGNRHNSTYNKKNEKWACDLNPPVLTSLALKALSRFPVAMTVHTGNTTAGITHAGLTHRQWVGLANRTIDEDEWTDLIYHRGRVNNQKAYRFIPDGIDFSVHGHTPQQKPVLRHNSIYLDTGASRGHRLTALNLKTFCETGNLQKSCTSVKIKN